MSWMEYCCKTYDNCQSEIGKSIGSPVPLLPLSHTTQNVNIEIELNNSGDFLSARLISLPEKRITIIPCTENSATRTSGLEPHPLVDKLQYIAANYNAFGGAKKSGWQRYHENLSAWCSSPYSNPDVCAVLAYLEKERLIQDLVDCGILYLDENGKLPTKWTGEKGNMPPVCATLPTGDQTESFVRFVVDGRTLASPSVQESFQAFYASQLKSVNYCMIQGQMMPLSSISPYKIRNSGDHAKLISSNDSSNFTYRGRFASPEQALSIGYQTSQKAHSALRWLIGKQGKQIGSQAVLVWGTKDEPIPDATADSLDIACDSDWNPDTGSIEDLIENICSTQDAFAKRFNKALSGYSQKLDNSSQTAVIILDSATPGRLSIRYYHELAGSRLLALIEDWHRSFVWLLEYRYVKKPAELGQKAQTKYVKFVGAPSLKDIAHAAYGENADDKLIQQTIERLMPCIIEKRPFPRDIMLCAAHRATNAISLEKWEARKAQSIACALIRGYYHRNKKEDFPMGIDESSQDRNYLFGRILACAEQIERRAQKIDKESDADKRPTNAERLRVAFVQHPAKTTAVLQDKLMPYINHMRANGHESSRYILMQSLLDRLGVEGFTNQPLNELYLLGYASQMMEFRRENQEFQKSLTQTDSDAQN